MVETVVALIPLMACMVCISTGAVIYEFWPGRKGVQRGDD